MEQIDATLLKIIFGVIGFIFFCLTGIIAWLFRGMDSSLKGIYKNQTTMQIDLAEVKKDLRGVDEKIQRELDMMRENLQHIQERTTNNSERITDMNKELGALSEWKKLNSKS